MAIHAYAGKQLWIWEVSQSLGGDIESIVSLGKDLGLSGFLVKAHDGGAVWPQFQQVLGPLKQAGFLVGAWGYVYSSDIVAEARAAQTVIEAGADWYVFDGESSFNGAGAAADQLGGMVRKKNPNLTIGYAPFALPHDHPSFPYAEFSQYCNVCLPQVYWSEFGIGAAEAVTESVHQLAGFGLPIAPIGQAYGSATSASIGQFAASARARDCVGVSFWDLQSANTRQLQAVKNIREFVTVRSTGAQSRNSQAAGQGQGISVIHEPASPTDSDHSGACGMNPTSLSELPRANGHATALGGGMPTDAKESDWFYGAAHDLLARGIVTAYRDGLFKPDEAISRAQATDWLNRLRIYLEKG